MYTNIFGHSNFWYKYIRIYEYIHLCRNVHEWCKLYWLCTCTSYLIFIVQMFIALVHSQIMFGPGTAIMLLWHFWFCGFLNSLWSCKDSLFNAFWLYVMLIHVWTWNVTLCFREVGCSFFACKHNPKNWHTAPLFVCWFERNKLKTLELLFVLKYSHPIRCRGLET